MSNIRTQLNKVIGKSLNAYYQKVKPTIDDIKFKEQYQGRIIDCMVGEVDDNYIETPETDASIVKLEYSKEGVVKIPNIKGKTILVDVDGNETDTPGEGCRLISVGENEDNKIIIVSKNIDDTKENKTEILLKEPLRKINNDIYDEIVGNKLIRKIGRVILNGTEGYEEYVEVNNRLQNVIGYFTQINDIKMRAKTLCNLLPSSLFDEKDTIGCKVGGSTHIHLYFSRETITSKDEFIQYISENPIEVIYELAEPIIEELPNSITLQGFDDTTVYIENSITPTIQYGYNALIPYKEELSNQKEKVKTNTLDIENNIIPYLMDMEFNLITMEDNE